MATLLATALTSLLLATQASDEPPEPCDKNTGDCEQTASVTDEITVFGEKSRQQIRQDFRILTDRMYTVFNNLNDQDDYDIVCRKERRVGSQIVRRICKARLFFKARSELAEGEATSTLRPSSVTNAERHEERLREITKRLASENPELMQLLRDRKAMLEEHGWLEQSD